MDSVNIAAGTFILLKRLVIDIAIPPAVAMIGTIARADKD